MKIELLGTGCPRCRSAEENLMKALEELSLEANIEKITGMAALTERGVSAPPAIAVDGKILTQGSIPGVEQVKLLLRQLSAT